MQVSCVSTCLYGQPHSLSLLDRLENKRDNFIQLCGIIILAVTNLTARLGIALANGIQVQRGMKNEDCCSSQAKNFSLLESNPTTPVRAVARDTLTPFLAYLILSSRHQYRGAKLFGTSTNVAHG